MSEKKQSSGGVVLYPLEYRINKEDADQSFVICRTLEGDVVAFYLDPPEEARRKMETDSAATIPRINKFGETHRKATNPCFASLNNDKRNPNGILLGEQVSVDGDIQIEFNGSESSIRKLVGRWASVLRDSEDGLRSPIGYGYLESNSSPKLSPQGTDLKLKYDELSAILKNPDAFPDVDLIDVTSERERLSAAIQNEKKKWFVGVLMYPHRMVTLTPENSHSLKDVVAAELLRYTNKGVYGGAIVRVRRDDIVLSGLSKTVEHQYEYKLQQVKEIQDVIEDFMKFGGNRIVREAVRQKLEIDVIPLERFNCGKPGNDRYGKDLSSANSKVMKTFVDIDFHNNPSIHLKAVNGFIYSRVGMRLAQTVNDGTDNLLLSSLHAFSKPIGSILAIDKNGAPSYKLDRKIEQAVEA